MGVPEASGGSRGRVRHLRRPYLPYMDSYKGNLRGREGVIRPDLVERGDPAGGLGLVRGYIGRELAASGALYTSSALAQGPNTPISGP